MTCSQFDQMSYSGPMECTGQHSACDRHLIPHRNREQLQSGGITIATISTNTRCINIDYRLSLIPEFDCIAPLPSQC